MPDTELSATKWMPLLTPWGNISVKPHSLSDSVSSKSSSSSCTFSIEGIDDLDESTVEITFRPWELLDEAFRLCVDRESLSYFAEYAKSPKWRAELEKKERERNQQIEASHVRRAKEFAKEHGLDEDNPLARKLYDEDRENKRMERRKERLAKRH